MLQVDTFFIFISDSKCSYICWYISASSLFCYWTQKLQGDINQPSRTSSDARISCRGFDGDGGCKNQEQPIHRNQVDESLDIATTKKLVTFCKIVNNNQLKIEFCANIEVMNGTAETIYNAITEWLASVGVNIEKVSGFGSDGAAVMTGRRAGVGVRLQQVNPRITHIWCAAHTSHRVALVSYWAAKGVHTSKRYKTFL